MDNPRLCLIGAETILGKDIQETVKERHKDVSISTYSASAEGNFGEQEGEAIYLEPLSAKSVAKEQLMVLAGSEAGARKSLGLAGSGASRPVVLDVLGLLDGEKKSRLVSTLIAEPNPQPGELLVLAHPAATALVLTLSRLSKYQTLVRAVASVLVPASEFGQPGIHELHQQTLALLAFKPLPKDIFDAQLAFNTLAQLGEDSKNNLSKLETRIRSQALRLAVPLKAQPAMAQLSIRVSQAPVFHGYSIALFLEFSAKADRQAVEEALACAQIEVRALGEETPDAAGSAGISGLLAGDIRVDEANSKAVWIWLVFDNIRLLSDSVASIVSALRQESR